MMKKIFFIPAVLLFGASFFCNYLIINAQNLPFHFIKNDTIPVWKDFKALKFPWAGGFNAPQFSSIDLNFDGINDLFVFERSGNKILTFINDGYHSTNSFHFTRQYQNKFPALHDWALLRDYNCDNKPDIFSYSVGGSLLYKNTGSSQSGLSFELISNLINSYQGGTVPVNILITDVDIPAIADVDNDGDLDIFTFHPLGVYVQFHKNESKELYGNCDSLAYRLAENCWGHFAEGNESFNLFLNINCPWKETAGSTKKERHVGSTLLVADLDGDNDKDLLLGDIGFKGLKALYNGYNTDSCLFTSIDTVFPHYDVPVNIAAMPAAYLIDADNDGLDDLITTPTQVSVAKNHHNVLLYLNKGTAQNPVYRFETDEFLQKDMLDFGEGAFPLFFDYNSDGKMDLLVSNSGYYLNSYDSIGNLYSNYRSQLALLENIGTNNNPVYKLIDTNYANIAALNLQYAYPAMGDLDGDGDMDLVLGDKNGRLHFLKNVGPTQNPAFEIWYSPYPAVDAGFNSAPELIDINGDALLDLVVGEKYGKLRYYQNTGSSTNPQFAASPTINELGGVNVTDPLLSNWGFSTPRKLNYNGTDYLACGSYKGNVFLYGNIHQTSTAFELLTDNLLPFNEGERTAVCFFNLCGNSVPEMIVGNQAGGLGFYNGEGGSGIAANKSAADNIRLNPNPAKQWLMLNGNLPAHSQFEIYSITGVLQTSGLIPLNKTIDVSPLENGCYFILLKNNHFQKVLRFVKID